MNPGAPLGRPAALEARGLSKRFGPQWALREVDLRVEQGEVVALLGENGSGKSTLVKILTGFHEPEPGARLFVAGREVQLPVPPGDHRRIGIGCVFQDLGLAPGLRVVENLFVGRTASRRVGAALAPIDWRAATRQAAAVLSGYRVDLDPLATVAELRPTDQALLAIVRAAEELRQFRAANGGGDAAVGHGVLVLDEPTVFLPEHEKVFLFELVRQVTGRGTAVLFVSHDLTAVRQIADRAEVLRDGQAVGNLRIAEVSDQQVVERISGHRSGERAAVRSAHRPAAFDGAGAEQPLPVGTGSLVASGVSGGQLVDAELTLSAGEIAGVAGLLGSGSEDLPYALFGALPGARGELRLPGWNGRLDRLTPRSARQLGLALVPADRKRQGVAPALTVADNVMALALRDFWHRGVVRHRELRRRTEQRCAQYGVRPADPAAPVAALSGGNQQKVVLAKWLEHPPRVLLLHEPTQGVDVATRQEIYELMRALAAHGVAILWVSTDFDELATVCTRIMVCAGGRLVEQVRPGPPFTRDQITAAVYATASGQVVGLRS